MTTVYRSKVDSWLLVVLLGAMAVSLYTAGAVLAADRSVSAWLTAFVSGGLGLGLPLWLLLTTRYVLDPERLEVHSGPFAWTVPVREITRVVPTNNPLSSPALSLDRLRIEYGRGRAIMISPRDKLRFLDDLDRVRARAG